MRNAFKNFFKRFLGKQAGPAPMPGITEETIPADSVGNFAAVIGRVIPYFNKLNDANRQKFLNRVYNFRRAKRFHFHGMEPREEIAVLVSAAAVQLTFGLNNYLLPYFTDIYVLPEAYQHKDSKELYIGHVSPAGIYISWKHFVQGFSNYSDGVNVALHEMAHALHHENFIEETGVDWDFRQDFEKLPGVYGPTMSKAIIEKKSYLRGYAFTNFQEFWAVSAEHFFEDPQGMKSHLPHLYDILCRTLNQDPLNMNTASNNNSA